MPVHMHDEHLNANHLEFANNQLNVVDSIQSSLVKHYRADIDFETVSPHTIGEIPVSGIITKVLIKVTTVFNGTTPALDIGTSETANKYASSVDIDLTTIKTYVIHLHEFESSAVNAMATIAVSGATQGAASILVEYTQP